MEAVELRLCENDAGKAAAIVGLSLVGTIGVSTPLRAQRHGRADSVQNYARSTPPELDIQWTSQHERDRWRAADLDGMDSRTVVTPLSKHSAGGVLSGIPLSDLFAKRDAGDAALVEVHYGFFHTKAFHWHDLDQDETIVITRRNGHRLADGFWLVAVNTHGRSVTVKGLNKVVVKTSSR